MTHNFHKSTDETQVSKAGLTCDEREDYQVALERRSDRLVSLVFEKGGATNSNEVLFAFDKQPKRDETLLTMDVH